MTSTFSDLARERFAADLADAGEDQLRSYAYSYLGLSDLHSHRSSSAWHWKADMVRDECVRRGRVDLFEEERAVVATERVQMAGQVA